jgi:hypothetical protein
MLSWLRRRGGEESGVVLVVVAGMLVVIIGCAALAIDIGSFYKAQRRAQSAADAGALAASQDLPGGAQQATTDGSSYAGTNYPGSTVSVATGYQGVASQVKVTVKATTPSFFGQIFGLTSENVSATAVAGAKGGSAPAAVFAYDDNCSHPGIAFNGNNENVIGGVISNGSLSQQANPNATLGNATYGGPNGCSYTNAGSGVFTSGPTVNPALTAFPTDYSTQYPIQANGFPSICPSVAATLDWSNNNYEIPDGVYCANTIKLTGNHLSGSNVTFIANNFVVTSQNMTLSAPPSTKLLFWDLGTSTLDIADNSLVLGTTNDGTTGGTIFAPSATVQIDGNTAGTGFIESNDVIVNGNSFAVTGWGPVVSAGGYSLVQ